MAIPMSVIVMHELLSPAQMVQCDALTIQRGTPGTLLMERAGQAVADCATRLLPHEGRVLALAGPGNNGGDAYVAARLLMLSGYRVLVASLGETTALRGDARWAFEGWMGPCTAAPGLDSADLEAHDLVLDGLFGAGLTRPLDRQAAALVELVNGSGKPVLAIDLPSGLDGRTGQSSGAMIRAMHTITFHRLKPGHVLYPGRGLCGTLELADIGIMQSAVEETGYTARLTSGDLASSLNGPAGDAHKFARGHALVVGGPPEKAGAGFLAASAALRAGAGLVTLAVPPTTITGSVGQLPALMRAPCRNGNDLAVLLGDARFTCCALGPGLPPDETTRQMVYTALASSAALVLDAGALSAFAGMGDALFEAIKARVAAVVLTPHEGEFQRLFGQAVRGSKIEIAQAAAAQSGAILVLKGPDSVIAHPSQRSDCTYVNANAPPWLATAGSGDVLTGILAGLLASGKLDRDEGPALTRRVALGVWLHGQCGLAAGPALVASDLEPALRVVLDRLYPNDFVPL